MGQINVSLPADGETIDASDYNTPITTIVNEINGELDNSNIASDAAIAGTKLASSALFDREVNDTAGNEVLQFASTASAVNELTITNAATGNAPSIAATGGDTNIGLILKPKGTGSVQLQDSSGNTVLDATDSGWINFTLQNSWAAGGTETPAYRKLNGIVYLRGCVTKNTASTEVCATLPAGYRPAMTLRFAITSNTTVMLNGTISTDGEISMIASGSTSAFRTLHGGGGFPAA